MWYLNSINKPLTQPFFLGEYMATYSANQFKPGMKLLIDNDPCSLVSVEFVKPGKGQAFTRVKYKNLISKKAGLEKTFKASESVEKADVVETELTFLYRDDESFHFMDQATYEQTTIDKSVVAENAQWIVEQDVCTVITWNNKPISIQPANFSIMEVVECDPGLKGNTVSGGTKPATLETGATIRVPLFINIGDKLKIDNRNKEYVSRAKEDE
jgi:elongation factor P